MKLNTVIRNLALTISFVLWMARIGCAGTCGGAVQCNCGDTLIADHTMWYDLTDCAGNGLVIGADFITLDGGHHTIDGDGEGNPQCGIYLSHKSGVTVRNCVITHFQSDGIMLHHSANNMITDNELSNNGLGISMVFDSDANTVTYNNFTSDRIYIYYSDNNTIANNQISNTGGGIGVYESKGNTIASNSITLTSLAIAIYSNDNNTIEENDVSENTKGILLGSSASGNHLVSNRICSNTHYDIWMSNENSNYGDENTCDSTYNWNDDGATGCTYPCTIPSQSPVADFDFTPSSSRVGDPVTFTSTSYDPDGGAIQSYLWLIYPEHSAQPLRYTEPSFTHYFSEPGTYFVHHYVVDDEGDNASTGNGIEIADIDRWGLIVVPLPDDPALEGAKTLVPSFKNMLCRGGWQENHIKVLKGCDLNCLLNDGIAWLADKAKSDDKALIAFLTHGFNYLGFDWSSGLCLKQRDWWDYWAYITYGQLKDELESIQSPITVVLNACFSGSALGPLQKNGRVILASSDEDQYSYNCDFFQCLDLGFMDGDLSGDGWVSSEEAFSNADECFSYLDQIPQMGDYYPTITDNTDEMRLVIHREPDWLGPAVMAETGTVHSTSIKSASIDSTISIATFSVRWSGSDLDLTLERPDSTVVNPDSAQSNSNITYFTSPTFESYTINAPMPGEWKLLIEGVDVPPEGEEYLAQVVAETDLTMNMFLGKDQYLKGEPIKVSATILNGSDPVTGATVIADVVTPIDIDSVVLYDDGLHGDSLADDGLYANYYYDPDTCGLYRFTGKAAGTIGEGNFTRRGAETSAYLTFLEPVADAGGPYLGNIGEPILFDASESYDEDGSIVTYQWQFGDGDTGTGVNPTHPYSDDSIHTVTLTVTDEDGLTDSITTTACIGNPFVEFIFPLWPEAGDPLRGLDTLRWSAYDATDTTDLDICLYYTSDSGQTWTQINDTLENTGEYEWNTATVPDGVYALKIEATDKTGNVGVDFSHLLSIINRARGDANADGDVGLIDVVYLINYLFKGRPAPNPTWIGDVNCDDDVDLIDIVYLINYLFKGGPPPCA